MGSTGPVLHVLVVGFHHKKGNQVEFSYPPLIPDNPVDSNEVPEVWKYLPSLALPDGAHNYKKDTVYFHLPSNDEKSRRTVYGVSCYRQIDATELLNRGADVTRNSVQKCVCVLSTLPLYGLIEAKLELITHAYFKERDFSEVSLLEDTYTNLNLSLSDALVSGSQVFLGLSCRDVVSIFRNRILVLFKMMLLERRILFFSSPVKPTVNLMLTVLSLFPGMLENGLVESASYSPSKQLSPTMKMTKAYSLDDTAEEFLEVHYTGDDSNRTEAKLVEERPPSPVNSSKTSEVPKTAETVVREQPKSDPLQIDNITHVEAVQQPSSVPSEDILSTSPVKGVSDPLAQVDGITHREKVQSVSEELHSGELEQGLPDAGTLAKMEEMIEEDDACFSWEDDKLLLEIDSELDSQSGHSANASLNESAFKDMKEKSEKTQGASTSTKPESSKSDDKESSQSTTTVGQLTPEKLGSKIKDKFSSLWQGQVENGVELQDMRPVSPTNLKLDEHGFPLSVFTKGVLCHPYLCLQYYDLLGDVNVRGFVIGATNALFKQKKHMIDVIVELLDTEGNSDGKIEITDAELRKQLSLSTADLRFADAIAKAVISDPDDTEWEGGDEWIRSQFRAYITSLLATATSGDESTIQDFNPSFVAAWKTTHNYRVWKSVMHEGMKDIPTGHPCHGQIGVGDFRLKFAHTMQSTEKGKKINAAIGTTGRAVVQTGKAVGGAFSIAKKSVSSWFTGIKDWNQQAENAAANEESTDVQKVPKS